LYEAKDKAINYGELDLTATGFQHDEEGLIHRLNIMNQPTDTLSDIFTILVVFSVIGSTLLLLKTATSLKLIKAKA